MILLLFGLVFIHCAKGDGIVVPITPNGDTGFEISDTKNLPIINREKEVTRNTQNSITGYHSQVSPFMPLEVLTDMEDALLAITSEPLDEGDFYFLYYELVDETNPPVISFAFAASRDLMTPDDIIVQIDGTDVSLDAYYHVHTNKSLNTNYYLGTYSPNNYMNPENQHQLYLQFEPPNQSPYQENFSFTVPLPEELFVVDAFIMNDLVLHEPMLDKIMVSVEFFRYIVIGDRLIEPINWSLVYDDQTNLPFIQSIEKLHEKYYIITLSENVATDRFVEVSYSPIDGFFTLPFVFQTPNTSIIRGGESYRKVAGTQSCKETCGDGYLLTAAVEAPIPCSNHHTVELTSTCPQNPGCDGQLVKIMDVWLCEPRPIMSFPYPESYVLQHMKPALHAEHASNCIGGNSIYTNFSFNSDYNIDYHLKGIIPYPYEVCDPISDTVNVFLESDKMIPFVDASWNFERPTGCGTDTDYILEIVATDNHCIIDHPLFNLMYIITNPATGEEEHFPVTFLGLRYLSYMGDELSFIREYVVDNPNVFACADYFQTLVFDKKGNWNSVIMEKQSGEIFNPEQIPYPKEIFLEFGERVPDIFEYLGGGISQAHYTQWVNLDRAYPFYDENFCMYKIDKLNHGPLIYMEASVLPDLPGIIIRFDYEDPEFQRPRNERSPTNDYTFGNAKYSDVNNPDLDPNPAISEFGRNYLWGSHPAYGKDGKELGDNFNYYHNQYGPSWSDYLTENGVPSGDPIRDHIPDKRPCWQNTNCIGLTEPENCLDDYCTPGSITKSTNRNGRTAIYFDTKSHGGDNFRFKVSGVLPNSYIANDCLKKKESAIFTLWRKMYVEYSWMGQRTGPPPTGCGGQIEYDEEHKICEDKMILENHLKGVFDDAFIDVSVPTEQDDTEYAYWLNSSGILTWSYVGYGDSKLLFSKLPDRVSLCGVDHVEGPCENPFFGMTTCSFLISAKQFYAYVAVGNINDKFLNNPGIFRQIDRHPEDDIEANNKNTAAHEIVHNFYDKWPRCGTFSLDNAQTHGLMSNRDRRSYMHYKNIILLRDSLNIFDSSSY